MTAAEVREMLRRLQGVPDAMEAQEREIEFWKQRAVRYGEPFFHLSF